MAFPSSSLITVLLTIFLQASPALADLSITKKASIGIAVPLGVLLIFAFAGLLYATRAKRRRAANGEVVELTDQERAEIIANQKTIRWNPHGN
jgi:hypothetical protein